MHYTYILSLYVHDDYFFVGIVMTQYEFNAPATASLSGHWARTDEIIIRYAVTRLTSKDFSLSGRYIIHLHVLYYAVL